MNADSSVDKRNPAWPLIFVTHATAGLFFAYETAGSLAPYLSDELGFTSHQIGLMYSAYSIPAIISIFLNGYLNKRFGAPKIMTFLTLVISVGASLVALAPNFPLMFIGQLIYGAGSGPTFLTATFITGKWFGTDAVGKRKISFALGFVFAWLRLLSFASLFLLPIIAQHSNFRVSMWVSALVCWSSFVSSCIFFVVDRANNYTVNAFAEDTEMSEIVEHIAAKPDKIKDDANKEDANEDAKADEDDTEDMEANSRYLAVSVREDSEETGNGNSAIMVTPESEDVDANPGEAKKSLVSRSAPKETIEMIVNAFHTVRGFTPAYWLILALMVIFISDLYTCTAFLTKFLYEEGVNEAINKNHNSTASDAFSSSSLSEDTRTNIAVEASAVTSLVCLFNVITSPICGWLSGYTGWKVKYIILGSINLVLIHCLFAFSDSPPYILASALGLTQSIMDTNMWPCLIFTVPKKHYPFALSLVTLSYNIGLILFPIACGFLQDLTHTWLSVNMAFIVVSSCSVVLSIALKLVDLKNGDILDLPFIKPPTKT